MRILILILATSFCFSQESIYISENANIYTFDKSQITIFGDLINDSKGGFNHNNGGEVYIFRDKNNGKGNSRIYDGPNANIGNDNYNKDGSYCRFWTLHTNNIINKSVPSGTLINTESGNGNIQIEQEVIISNKHYFDNGMIWTPRNRWQHAFIHYENIGKSNQSICEFYNDDNHIDGYAAYSGKNEFNFPIGDGIKLRICGIKNGDISKAAYFNINPLEVSSGISGIIPSKSDFNNIDENIIEVSKTEFWDIDGISESQIQLYCLNSVSGYSGFAANFIKSQNITIAGFNGKWKNLEAKNIFDAKNDTIYYSQKSIICDPNYSLFTFAGQDSLIIDNVVPDFQLSHSFIREIKQSANDNVFSFEYTFGYSGNGIANIYNYNGELIYNENISFQKEKNILNIFSDKFMNSVFIIQILSSKNEKLSTKFIKLNKM